jgi:hypothetical protein
VQNTERYHLGVAVHYMHTRICGMNQKLTVDHVTRLGILHQCRVLSKARIIAPNLLATYSIYTTAAYVTIYIYRDSASLDAFLKSPQSSLVKRPHIYKLDKYVDTNYTYMCTCI